MSWLQWVAVGVATWLLLNVVMVLVLAATAPDDIDALSDTEFWERVNDDGDLTF
jgi:hypothetical protein